MKCRISAQSLRLRIDEAELDRLLRDGRIEDTTVFATDMRQHRRLHLGELELPSLHQDGDTLTVTLPRQVFEIFAAERPRRDGIDFAWPVAGEAPLRVCVEIDVRDSHRRARASRDDLPLV